MSSSAIDPFARIAPYYDALMASVPYDYWATYVSHLAALAGHPIYPGSRLLDLATGTGSVALEFASRGCIVTGIDLSDPMLVEARRKAAERSLIVEFLCANLSNFDLPPKFDHAVCLYDSLNYILELDNLKQAFANIWNTLKPGALLIFDVNTVRALEQELFTQRSRNGAEVEYSWVSKYDPKSHISRIVMNFKITATGERFKIVHHQRAYSDAELQSLLLDTGFVDITTYDAYQTTPITPESDRAFYAARR